MENINFETINKILIIGGPEMGKSTLANKLSEQLDLPVCHIDAINYKENWIQRDKKERDDIILKKVNEEKWILDGLYKETLQESMEKSDLIIILWFSKYTQLKGIFKRHIKNKEKEREDIPGCIDKLELEFIKFTLRYKTRMQPIIDDILQGRYIDKVLMFKKQKELNKWYEKTFKTKIF